MVKIKFCMFAALVFMITIPPVVGLTKENNRDKMKKVMENTTPAERADIQTNLMGATLSLSDEQAEHINAINLKYAKKVGEIYNSQGSKFRKFWKMRKLGNDKDQELKSVLSNEQYEKYEKIKKEIRDKTMEKLQQ